MSRPILFDYITSRTGEGEKLFMYDFSKDMNVLISNQNLDFIEYGKAECITQTETRVAREADDKEYGLCELASKTEVSRERDDEDVSFVELMTKTAEDNRERDDEDVFSLAELKTKTFIDRERDDEDDYYLN